MGTPSNSVPRRTVFWEELKHPTCDRFGGEDPFVPRKGQKMDDIPHVAPAATLWKLITVEECVSLSFHHQLYVFGKYTHIDVQK